VIPISDWPQPVAGVPAPKVWADESSVFLRYYTDNKVVVVVHFPSCHQFKFGAPNDEALGGHPLYVKGLGFYGVFRVENSSWIEQLERQNSVHPSHGRKWFLEGKQHYIFTFHDSTLECVVNSDLWPPEVKEFQSAAEADEYIQRGLNRKRWDQSS
jgi:hypothetical protein